MRRFCEIHEHLFLRRCTRSLVPIHRYSGVIISIFFLVHLINHLFAWGGAEMHIRVMEVFRTVYRFPAVEGVLLVAAVAQVVSGPVLVWKMGLRKKGFDLLQVLSGLYLSFFLFYHIRAVMLARYVWDVETNFHFAAWGVKHSPADRFFLPYYSLSILCVFIHLACVHRKKMIARHESTDDLQRAFQNADRHVILIIMSGVVITVLVLCGFILA